jgi:hypothetical protein|nr:hypothetical protein [uncultured Oscillibacter sp.]
MYPECISSISELSSLCQNDDIIVYGTGKIGSLMISHLHRNTNLNILGATNSHVERGNAGTFSDTGLPVRTPQEWYEQFPHAVILIATVRQDFQFEIEEICRRIGFQKILAVFSTVESELISAQAKMLFSTENKALVELLVLSASSYLVDWVCLANEIQDVHKASFAEFRGCHKNQSVALVGAGPSLNAYKQLEGIPHIGVNSAFLKPGIHLDYYFAQDYQSFRGKDGKPEESWYNSLKNYQFVKFFGTAEWTSDSRRVYQIPETLIEENHARRFTIQAKREFIHCDIEHYPLMGLGSIIFSAFHFALHTRPKRILLIGCDCSSAGHYDGSIGMSGSAGSFLVNSWKWVKDFTNRFYPGTEIISVNPVGLKGLFRDVYTEAYLKAHPEIDRSACELLDSAFFD